MTAADRFLAALAYGFALSAPVGPTAILCIRRGLAGRPWLGFAAGLGCGACDLATCWIVLAGIRGWPIAAGWPSRGIEALGGLSLIGMALAGVAAVRRRREQHLSPAGSDMAGPTALLRAWLEGTAITLANPLNTASVSIFAASLAAANQGHGVGATAVGLAAGILGWWSLLAWAAWTVRGRVGERTMRFLDLATSAALGALGVMFIARALS